VGKALSLAEKLDNMVGCFALGLLPTGSADPYALRRQAQGALRLIEESERHFSLTNLLKEALQLLPAPHSASAEAVPKLMEFLRDRLIQMALDRGAPLDLVNATLASGFDDVCDFWARLSALRGLSRDSVWQDLVIAVERTYNISKNAPEGLRLEPALFKEPSEKELAALLAARQGEIEELEKTRDYVGASRRYAEVFAGPLHEFFEKVFVNVEDERLRNNRLELMRRINRLYSARIADLSQITTGVQK
jgi:glycyl-tRNA synthetase beta chain